MRTVFYRCFTCEASPFPHPPFPPHTLAPARRYYERRERVKAREKERERETNALKGEDLHGKERRSIWVRERQSEEHDVEGVSIAVYFPRSKWNHHPHHHHRDDHTHTHKLSLKETTKQIKPRTTSKHLKIRSRNYRSLYDTFSRLKSWARKSIEQLLGSLQIT